MGIWDIYGWLDHVILVGSYIGIPRSWIIGIPNILGRKIPYDHIFNQNPIDTSHPL